MNEISRESTHLSKTLLCAYGKFSQYVCVWFNPTDFTINVYVGVSLPADCVHCGNFKIKLPPDIVICQTTSEYPAISAFCRLSCMMNQNWQFFLPLFREEYWLLVAAMVFILDMDATNNSVVTLERNQLAPSYFGVDNWMFCYPPMTQNDEQEKKFEYFAQKIISGTFRFFSGETANKIQ
ncbi:MAG: hypothetical protein M0R33_15505 [Methylomonas sp.]|uniref:hypothetical protein n=1 Tax=Methylomonas sp. TaxID=418 RepID=UPI0025CC082D|nr:hypothetical protein [Methylomonas sp.]MCK9607849.1 hypothetical protein [Methylomonas sp.]